MDGDWIRLGKAITRRRVELGLDTIAAFARHVGLSTRLLGDLEGGRRASYDPATLAKVEQALDWPGGRVEEILNQWDQPFMAIEGPTPDTYTIGPADSIAAITPADPSWLSTPEGIARHIHRDDLPLVALLHRAGLTESDLFKLILHVRAVRERQNADLLADLAQRIRDLGGHAPDRPYPPTWLAEDD